MSIAQSVRNLIGSAFHSEISTVEAAGLANAVAGVAVSFDSGLLPRTLPQQAVLTGLWGALTYGVTATTQSFIEASVRRILGGRESTAESRRAAIIAADAAVLATGIALQKAFPQRREESMSHAAVR